VTCEQLLEFAIAGKIEGYPTARATR